MQSQAELQEKTACRFSYELVKRSHHAPAIRFTLVTKNEEIELVAPELPAATDSPDDPMANYAAVLPENFTEGQVAVLVQLAFHKVSPHPIYGYEIAVIDYLRHKVLVMNATKTKKPHPYNYLKAMIEKDPDVNC